MKTWFRYSSVVAVAAIAFMFGACSDDNNNNGPTGPDTTGPTVTSVTSADANHVNVKFSEEVDRTSAEDEGNYSIVETAPLRDANLAPGDPVAVANASLRDDGRTVTLTTGASMTTTGYRVIVNNVKDVNGNEVKNGTEKQFAGSSTPDQTAPEVIHKEPAANATNVNRNELINIEFSEPLAADNFNDSFALTTNGTPVPVDITSSDNVHFTVTPTSVLASGKLYTVALVGVQDATGNIMANTQWSFHTAASTDNTPPHLVSSVPANAATGVATSSTISMTFSEPIDTGSFTVDVTPTLGIITPVWSNSDKTMTIAPAEGLSGNQEYTVTILPNGVQDLNGNGNENAIIVTFSTTGSAAVTGVLR
jgi:methionine-rich copper-binding protein CopC